jgi:DNA-binding MarR family transcriptional regulator
MFRLGRVYSNASGVITQIGCDKDKRYNNRWQRSAVDGFCTLNGKIPEKRGRRGDDCMCGENEQMIKNIVAVLRRLLRAVYMDNAKMNRQYGVTGPQGGVLRSLRDSGPASSAELSRTLYVTPSTMTGLIDRLESKGLVERIKKVGDRRVLMITLTSAGEELSHRLPDPLELRLVSKLSDLDIGHVKQLSAGVDELLSMVEPAATETLSYDEIMEQASANKSIADNLLEK